MVSVSENHVCYTKLCDRDYRMQFVCKDLKSFRDNQDDSTHSTGVKGDRKEGGLPTTKNETVDMYMDSFSLYKNGLLDSSVYYQSLGESNSCSLFTKPAATCFGKNRKGMNAIPVAIKHKIAYISTN